MLPFSPNSNELRRRIVGFSLPPGWGRHKLLRCSNALPITNRGPSAPRSTPTPEDDDAFLELRWRLLSHYGVAGKPSDVDLNKQDHAEGDNPRPWNLRKRRSACGAPQGENSPSSSPSEKAQASPADKQRVRTSIQLSLDEIEEDLARMSGEKCARKPKRRGHRVQRVMVNLNPGECLCRMLGQWYRFPGARKRR